MSPLTTAEVAEAPACVGVSAVVPAYGVIVYPVIGLPLSGGAVHRTWAELVAGSAATPVGAAGTAAAVGVTEFDLADSGPGPPSPIPCTVNVYAVPAVRPETVALVAGADTVVAVCAA